MTHTLCVQDVRCVTSGLFCVVATHRYHIRHSAHKIYMLQVAKNLDIYIGDIYVTGPIYMLRVAKALATHEQESLKGIRVSHSTHVWILHSYTPPRCLTLDCKTSCVECQTPSIISYTPHMICICIFIDIYVMSGKDSRHT